MARSWFELTLWHGTPEELTSVSSVEIVRRDNINVNVSTIDELHTNVKRTTEFSAVLASANHVDVEINIKSGVIASVDANGN